MNSLRVVSGVRIFSLFSVSLLLIAASIGCRSAYYAAYEKFGVYKRDLLKKRVVEARDEQAQAGEQFKDALTRLKELSGFDGGKLERGYTELQQEFKECETQASKVKDRITAMDTVANDLFSEWSREIEQITTPSLAKSSKEQLAQTKERYAALSASLKKAEESMAPILVQFRDYVLYLKHNLNAQAIASLRGEATSIQNEVGRLISQMNAAIARADQFVKELQ